MEEYGFIKVAASIPNIEVANPNYNAEQIINHIKEASKKLASVIIFPELCITGCTCADLFHQEAVITGSIKALEKILKETKDDDIISIVGLPLPFKSAIYNVAAIIFKGEIKGFIPKQKLANHNESYEQRWFKSGESISCQNIKICNQEVPFGNNILFQTKDFIFGVELNEDLFAHTAVSSKLINNGAEIIFNAAADNDIIGKYDYLNDLLKVHSKQNICGYVLTSCGFGESTTDTVYGGKSLIYECGEKLCEAERFAITPQIIYSDIDIQYIKNCRRSNITFAISTNDNTDFNIINIEKTNKRSTLNRKINSLPFIPSKENLDKYCKEIFSIQTNGLAKRFIHAKSSSLVIGISGGLDSTLALLVCVETFKKIKRPLTDIIAITMPGFGTTDRTYNNAHILMKSLGVTIKEISIKDACINHFKDIEHDIEKHDTTYENAQARERTQILMDVANANNGLVVGTGDLSELALGWATYNGDHMSMYGVNGGVPKTLIQFVVKWVADNSEDKQTKETLLDILATPISPELTPHDEKGNIKQKTEDLVGPYELHDFFLYNLIKNKFTPEKVYFLAKNAFADSYDNQTILKWLKTFIRRFFTQQFKRSCIPDGPKIGEISLSPRADWKMPSDASYEQWLDNIKE